MPDFSYESPHERVREGRVVAPPTTASGYTTTASYALVSGGGAVAELDSLPMGGVFISGRLENLGGTNTAMFKVQASIKGGDTDADWEDLIVYEEDATAFSSAEITVGTSAFVNFFITPAINYGVTASYRFYRIVAKNGAGSTTVRVWLMVK